MSIRERLKEAYENVSFNADRTWTDRPCLYHKTNLELYLTEQHLQRAKMHRIRPRTVRECIPRSRLAHYNNFVYNESREMSYAPSLPGPCAPFAVGGEPWEVPEVEDLFGWFIKNLPEDHFCRLKGCHESPLLNVSGFEDKILKIHVTEDRIKNIWKSDNTAQLKTINSNEILIKIYTTPLRNFLIINRDTTDYSYNEWYRNNSYNNDLEQLHMLIKSLKEQNAAIDKFLLGPFVDSSAAESSSTEVLYSEVLQGLAPSRKTVPTKSEQTRPQHLEDVKKPSSENFTNFTVLGSHQKGNCDCNASNSAKLVANFHSPHQSSMRFDGNLPTRRFVDSGQFDRSARSSQLHPFSYVQQTYFYSPVVASSNSGQRWVPNSAYYPTQILTSSWISQNHQLMPYGYDANRLLGTGQVPFPKTSPDVKECCDVGKSVELRDFIDDAVEEVPVSTSVSEELEIQALEQYSNSNENFYQELERQAAEQYASSPE